MDLIRIKTGFRIRIRITIGSEIRIREFEINILANVDPIQFNNASRIQLNSGSGIRISGSMVRVLAKVDPGSGSTVNLIRT